MTLSSTNKPRVLLVANTGWYLYNFRLPLARHLREVGYDVYFLSPKDAYVERLEAEDFHWVELPLNRKSMNPLKEVVALSHFCRIYKQLRPAICHHFTIKCVLYGTVAAKLTGVKAVVNAITGLGHTFLGQGLLNRMLRPFLRMAYRKILTARRVEVVFQNGDDLAEFRQQNIVNPSKSTIIRGSGVNLQRFQPRPGELDGQPAPMVLFASRLLKEKGLMEFVEAARLVKSRGLRANFAIAGDFDNGNPSAISKKEMDAWCEEGLVDYLGHADRMEDVLKLSHMVVLPSYREGTPRILLEAAAMGKPLVTTDVPGCREVVQHKVNGLLVPAKDAVALADAIETLLRRPELCVVYGAESRRLVHDFEEGQVIHATVQVYEKAMKAPVILVSNYLMCRTWCYTL